MNKLSKLTALLLALVLALGVPMQVLADGIIDTETKYEAQVSEILEKLYNAILQMTTYEEILAATETMTRTEIEAFLQRLIDDLVVTDGFEQYDAHIWELFEVYLESRIFPKIVDYTNVAPFLPPVTGTASVFSLLTRGSTVVPDNSATQGMVSSKTVAWEANKSEGIITIETFATGAKVTTTTKDIPTDVILVLDRSGSMQDRLYTYTAIEGQPDYWSSEDYYVELNGSYVQANYCYICRTWTYGCEHRGFNGGTPGTDVSDKIFYTQTPGETKNQALQGAVEAFRDEVYKKAAGADGNIATTGDNVDHRLAVVSYSSSAKDQSNGFISVNTTAGQSSFNRALTNTLNLKTGATRTELGIQEALNILNNNSVPEGEQRNQVVIVFTDGVPTTNRTWDDTVADNAIDYAYDIKNKGASVYTIGVVDGANPALPSTEWTDNDINRFLHYVSSNYPDAQSQSNGGTGSNQGYYLAASSSSALTSIFKQLAGSVSGGSSATLTDESIVKDVLTSTFQLPAGASSIRIYTADCTAVTTNTDGSKTYTFNDAARTQVYPATNATIYPTIDGQSISVTGFDFSKHWCGTETVNGTTTTRADGKKLIIEIDIEPVDGYLGGNVVETNEDTSGVYENSSATSPVVKLPDADDVNVKPLTIKPKVITQDLNIYLTNSVNVVDVVLNLGYFWDDVNSDGKLDWTDTDKDGVFDPGEDTATDEIYTVDGIRNKDADLVYTIKDGNTILATFTIPAGKTYADVESINWIKYGTKNEVTELTTLLEDDRTYTVTCEVIQTTTGTLENGGFPSTIDSDTATINVFKPVLTFRDSVVDYNSDLTNDTTITTLTGYYEQTNYVSEEWIHSNNLSTAVQMIGTKPGLTITYSEDADTDIIDDAIVNKAADIAVSVVVELATTDTKDDTELVGFKHSCDCTVADDEEWACQWSIADDSIDGSPAFLLHVINIYGKLTIKKEAKDTTFAAGETFVFDVTGPNDFLMTVVIPGEGSVTIAELPLGVYTVTENVGWSWRYEPIEACQKVQVVTAGSTVTFSNKRDKTQWIDGSTYAENVFGDASDSNAKVERK